VAIEVVDSMLLSSGGAFEDRQCVETHSDLSHVVALTGPKVINGVGAQAQLEPALGVGQAHLRAGSESGMELQVDDRRGSGTPRAPERSCIKPRERPLAHNCCIGAR
jgi:hypothetical protein